LVLVSPTPSFTEIQMIYKLARQYRLPAIIRSAALPPKAA